MRARVRQWCCKCACVEAEMSMRLTASDVSFTSFSMSIPSTSFPGLRGTHHDHQLLMLLPPVVQIAGALLQFRVRGMTWVRGAVTCLV